jgi:hypothetical protein
MIPAVDILSRIAKKVTPTPVRNILRPYWHDVVMMPTGIALRRAQKDLSASGSPLSREEKMWLERVSLRLHPHDDMYDKSVFKSEYAAARFYLSVGLSACCCIDKALVRSLAQERCRTKYP